MKKVRSFVSAMIVAASFLWGGCSQSDFEKTSSAALNLRINPTTSFQSSLTRGVDFSVYNNTSAYNIKIVDKATGLVAFEGQFSDLTEENNKFREGSYTLLASLGTLQNATQGNFYVEGETEFEVSSEKISAGNPIPVSVECLPKCARVSVAFGQKMSDYFSDYYVTYSTKALTAGNSSAVWSKENAEPWYLNVDDKEVITAVIHVVRKSDDKWTDVEYTHELSATQAWTLGVDVEEPVTPTGEVGLVITIDESTNDKPETIIVPNDWWV